MPVQYPERQSKLYQKLISQGPRSIPNDRRRLTCCEVVVLYLDALGPTVSLYPWLPYLHERSALCPSDGNSNAQCQVDCDDDEPHQDLDPSRGDTQNRDGERRFTPTCSKNRKGAR